MSLEASSSSTLIDLSDVDEIETSLEAKKEHPENDASLALSTHKAFAFTRKELEGMPVPYVIDVFLRNQNALHRALMQLDNQDIKLEAPKVNIHPQLAFTNGRSEWSEEKITKACNRLSELCRQGIVNQMRKKVPCSDGSLPWMYASMVSDARVFVRLFPTLFATGTGRDPKRSFHGQKVPLHDFAIKMGSLGVKHEGKEFNISGKCVEVMWEAEQLVFTLWGTYKMEEKWEDWIKPHEDAEKNKRDG